MSLAKRLTKLEEVTAAPGGVDPATLSAATALEARGCWVWYAEMFGQAFVDVLAPHHREAIEWHWDAKMAQRRGEQPNEDAYFAIWSRGHMKSTIARRIAVADACLSTVGYCLYTAGTVGKIQGHAKSIETLLTSVSVKRWYPALSRVRKSGAGNSKGWTNDFIYTDQGYVFHFVSLDQGIRGANVDDVRPTLIVPDDIDEPNDSPAVSKKRFRTLTRSVLPTRQSGTLVFVAQNLIAKHSVVNQIVTGKERALTRRKVTPPIPALVGLVTEFRMVGGVGRDIIVAGEPTWEFYDRERCQEEVDTIGLPAFNAECQHDLDADDAGRVLPEYDEAIHVITWSQVEKKYGVRYIPASWNSEIGHDIGYTEGHLSAVAWVATSAANTKLPNKRFRYRGLTFLDTAPDEMAQAMIAAMRPDPAVGRLHDERPLIKKWWMSAEKKGERKIYRDKYQLPYKACDDAKTAGIPQWRHYLRADKKRPHPFHADTQLADGSWLLGEPGWFDIVDDDQLQAPRDDKGLKLFREQALVWPKVAEHLTEKGLTPEQPLKAFEDTCDATRMITAGWGPVAKPKTKEEKREEALPEPTQLVTIEQLPPEEQGQAFATREHWLDRLKAKERAENNKQPGRFVNRHSFTGRKR